jgi:hypothetical protein
MKSSTPYAPCEMTGMFVPLRMPTCMANTQRAAKPRSPSSLGNHDGVRMSFTLSEVLSISPAFIDTTLSGGQSKRARQIYCCRKAGNAQCFHSGLRRSFHRCGWRRFRQGDPQARNRSGPRPGRPPSTAQLHRIFQQNPIAVPRAVTSAT